MKWSDKQVLKQATQKLHRKMQMAGRPPSGWAIHGPGHANKGSIFDCNREYFERALKTYFSELYLGWNPYKNEGRGVWEVWQMPVRRKMVYQGRIDGVPLYTAEIEPNDFEHHVYDLPYLTVAFIDKLREMDSWLVKDYFRQADYKQWDQEDKEDKIEEDNIKYVVRHNKDLFGKLKGLAQDGFNPFWFFSDKRQGDGQV